MKTALLFVVLLTISCKSQKNISEMDDRLVPLVQDGYFPVEEPETQIITSQKELNAFFSRVNRTRKPGLPIPEVDFSKDYVLVACLGKKASDYRAVMRIASENDKEIRIVMAAENDISNEESYGYPFYVYKILKTDKKLTIEMLD